MSQYRYSPLSEKPNLIRLLQILPSKGEPETLRCELFEYALRESDVANHPHEALSYVWGSGNKPQSIIINNQELAITQNLYIALLHLRDHEISRIIWVDAGCINQEHKKEKEHQIRLTAAICAKASRVIIWLGEAQEDSDIALESIRIAGENPANPSNTKPTRLSYDDDCERGHAFSWNGPKHVRYGVFASRSIFQRSNIKSTKDFVIKGADKYGTVKHRAELTTGTGVYIVPPLIVHACKKVLTGI